MNTENIEVQVDEIYFMFLSFDKETVGERKRQE